MKKGDSYYLTDDVEVDDLEVEIFDDGQQDRNFDYTKNPAILNAHKNQYNYQPINYRQKYSWAFDFSYTQPDYKKIRDGIRQEQDKWIDKGYPLKAKYTPEKQLIRKKEYGLINIDVTDKSDIKKVMDFSSATDKIGINKLGELDSYLMRMLYFGAFDYEVDGITPSQAIQNKDNYEKYIAGLGVVLEKDGIKIGDDENSQKHWGGVGPDRTESANISEIMKIKQELLNRLTPPQNIINKEANLRLGKRINRNFINGTSYKPLVTKNIISPNKKRVLNIVDGSGSMERYSLENSPIRHSTNVMYALSETGLFDCDSFFTQDRTLSKAGDYKCYNWGGGEGMEDISARLSDMGYNYKDYDYIFVYTDCCISSGSKKGLQDIIGKTNHIIFCYPEDNHFRYADNMREDYPSLKIIDVHGTKDIVNNLVSFV